MFIYKYYPFIPPIIFHLHFKSGIFIAFGGAFRAVDAQFFFNVNSTQPPAYEAAPNAYCSSILGCVYMVLSENYKCKITHFPETITQNKIFQLSNLSKSVVAFWQPFFVRNSLRSIIKMSVIMSVKCR